MTLKDLKITVVKQAVVAVFSSFQNEHIFPQHISSASKKNKKLLIGTNSDVRMNI